MLILAFNLSSQKAEVGDLFEFEVFLDSHSGYTEKPCLEKHTQKRRKIKKNLTCLDTESQVLRKETPSPAAVFSECSKGMSQALTFRKTEFQQRLDLKFIKSLVAKSGS